MVSRKIYLRKDWHVNTPRFSKRIRDKITYRMKINKKLLLLLIPVAIIGFIINKSKSDGIPVTTTEVKRGEVKQTVSASGEINSNQTASLSFPSGAQITEVTVKEGDTVSKSQILVKGNSISEYNTYAQNLNALSQAKSNLETFKEQYKADPDAVSVYNDNIYWEKYNYYQKAVNSAEAQVFISQKSLSDKVINAPFDGIVTKIYFKISEQATASSPVIVISNPKDLYFLAEIDEADYGKIALEQSTIIDLDSFVRTPFQGKVSELAKFAQKNLAGNTVFKIKIGLPLSLSDKAVIGMHGDIEISTNTKTAVLFLDSSAITSEEDSRFVFKLMSGKAIKNNITVGLETDLDTEIISGISEGDTIIFPKNGTIKDGTQVSVIK